MTKKKEEPVYPHYPLFDDITRGNHGGNANSENANNEIHLTKAAMQKKIYEWLTSQGRRGGTLHEVCNGTGLKVQTVSGRLSEMKKPDCEFHIFWNGQKRVTGNSRPASAFVTSEGQLIGMKPLERAS